MCNISSTRPTRLSTWGRGVRAARRRSGKATFSATVRCGYNGASWKHSAVAPSVTGCPSMLTPPASGASNSASSRNRVVFPPPEGPTMTAIDPVGTSRLTSSRALTCPNVRVTPSMRSDTVVSAPAPAEQAGYRSEDPVDHRDDQRTPHRGPEIGDVQAQPHQVGNPLRQQKDAGVDHEQEQ